MMNKEMRNKFINDIIEFLNNHREDPTLEVEVESTKIEEYGCFMDGTICGKNNFIVTIKNTNFYEKTDDFSFVWKEVEK